MGLTLLQMAPSEQATLGVGARWQKEQAMQRTFLVRDREGGLGWGRRRGYTRTVWEGDRQGQDRAVGVLWVLAGSLGLTWGNGNPDVIVRNTRLLRTRPTMVYTKISLFFLLEKPAAGSMARPHLGWPSVTLWSVPAGSKWPATLGITPTYKADSVYSY